MRPLFLLLLFLFLFLVPLVSVGPTIKDRSTAAAEYTAPLMSVVAAITDGSTALGSIAQVGP